MKKKMPFYCYWFSFVLKTEYAVEYVHTGCVCLYVYKYMEIILFEYVC